MYIGTFCVIKMQCWAMPQGCCTSQLSGGTLLRHSVQHGHIHLTFQLSM